MAYASRWGSWVFRLPRVIFIILQHFNGPKPISESLTSALDVLVKLLCRAREEGRGIKKRNICPKKKSIKVSSNLCLF